MQSEYTIEKGKKIYGKERKTEMVQNVAQKQKKKITIIIIIKSERERETCSQ